MKVTSFEIIGPVPRDKDIFNGAVDVGVTLEGDDFPYVVEVLTPQYIIDSMMETEKQNFFEPGYPYIIVRELTPSVIRAALEAAAVEDAFWLKLYHATLEMDSNDINTILERAKKKYT
jgi:hypothetical protein